MSESTTTTKNSGTPVVITIIIVAVLAISIAANVFYLVKNRRVKNEIGDLKIVNDNLKTEIVQLNEQNQILTDTLTIKNKDISQKEVVISRLNEENATLQVLRVQVEEIQKISAEFNLQNEQLKKIQEKMKQTILDKQDKNKKLKDNLTKTK